MDLEAHLTQWQHEGLLTEEQVGRLRASSRTGVMPRQLGLFFIAGLANGVSLVLFALVHSVAFATHVLPLLWMGSLLPLLYLSRSRVLAGLVGVVFVLWVPLFALREPGLAIFSGSSIIPVVLLLGGTTLFGLGGLHYVVPALMPVARGFRIVALVTVTLALFVLGLSFWAARSGGPMVPLSGGSLSSTVVGLAAVAALLAAANMFVRQRAPLITRGEGPISLGLIAVSVTYFLVPLPGSLFVVGFNVVALAMLGLLLVTGWKRADLRIIDIASAGLLAIFITRWIDHASGSVTFGVLVGGGAGGFVVLGGLLWWQRQRVVERARQATLGRPVSEQ